MKKLTIILLGIALSLVMTGCGSSDEKPSEEPKEPTTEENVVYDKQDEPDPTYDTQDYANDVAIFEEGDDEPSPTAEDTDLGAVADAYQGAPEDDEEEEEEEVAEAAVPDRPSPVAAVSSGPFKRGTYEFGQDCQMREEPSEAGKPAGTVRAGKSLWVDKHDDQWLIVYKKAGPVYISRGCLP